MHNLRDYLPYIIFPLVCGILTGFLLPLILR